MENLWGYSYFPTEGCGFWWRDKYRVRETNMQRYPDSNRTSAVSGTDTAPILPYPCFIRSFQQLPCEPEIFYFLKKKKKKTHLVAEKFQGK
jgi:hypothetical protein